MISLFLSPLAIYAAEKRKFVVVIDAGHGGNDVGASENGYHEKDINLAVALQLGELIKKKLKDTEVVYTRDGDYFISLQKRADIANAAKADLFISIHTNSVDKSNPNRANVLGATTYVLGLHKDSENLGVVKRENSVIELDADDSAKYAEFDPSQDDSYIIFEMTQKKNLQNSIRFASDVQKEMEKAGRKSRGVQQAGFWVLWSTAMPAALVELDFICNPEQAKFLGSKEGQEKLAGAIFNAVKKYEEYFRKNMELGAKNVRKDSGKQQPVAVAEEFQAQEVEPEETVSVSETADMAVLGTAQTEEKKEHLQASSTKNNNKTTRRQRRPKEGKKTAGNNIETAVIEVTAETVVEEIPAVEESTVLVASNETKSGKKDKKKEAKPKGVKKEKESKPARRDKESKVKAQTKKVKTVWKIQLFTSEELLAANDEAFKGLKNVSSIHENNIYKYTYGESKQKEGLLNTLEEIRVLFPDALIIKCISD